MPALETAPSRSAATLTFSNAVCVGPRIRAGHIPTRCSDQAALAARQAAVQASFAEGRPSGIGQLESEGHASPAGRDELRPAWGWQADSNVRAGQGFETCETAAATAEQQVLLGRMQLATRGKSSGGSTEPAQLPPLHGEPPTHEQLLEAVLLATAWPGHQQTRDEAKQDAGGAPSAASGLSSRSGSEGTSRLEQELGLTDNEAGLGHPTPLKVFTAKRQPDPRSEGRSARQQGVRDSIFEGSPHSTRPQSATGILQDATGSAVSSLTPQAGARVPYTPRTLDGMWNADAVTPRAAEQPRVQGQPTSLQHRPAAAELVGTVPQQRKPQRGFFTRSAGVTPAPPQGVGLGGSSDVDSPMAWVDLPVESEGVTGAAPETQSAGLATMAHVLLPVDHITAFRADRVRLPRIASEAAADMAEMVPLPEPGRRHRRRRRSSGGSVPQVPQPSMLPMHRPASERVTAARTLAFLAGASHLREAAHSAADPRLAGPANSCDALQQRGTQQMHPPTPGGTAAQPYKDPGGMLQVRSGAPARLQNKQWQASRRRAIVAMLQTEEALQATHQQQEQDVQVGSTLALSMTVCAANDKQWWCEGVKADWSGLTRCLCPLRFSLQQRVSLWRLQAASLMIPHTTAQML